MLTSAGEMRTFELSPSLSIRIAEADLEQELGRYLTMVGSARERDVRRMTIGVAGSAHGRSSSATSAKCRSGKRTTDVELSLVAGAPQSFIQQISQPYYAFAGEGLINPVAVSAKRTELAVASREIASRQDERQSIDRDQQRVRENMKALRGSAEERALLERYTKHLNAQEDRVEALRRDLAELTTPRDGRSSKPSSRASSKS
ncbi:MAG: hypothetical protein HYX76_13150 [Acidobacteria bacterium]|nr:hypothetical protein [Acidobacteriota bacterium]